MKVSRSKGIFGQLVLGPAPEVQLVLQELTNSFTEWASSGDCELSFGGWVGPDASSTLLIKTHVLNPGAVNFHGLRRASASKHIRRGRRSLSAH